MWRHGYLAFAWLQDLAGKRVPPRKANNMEPQKHRPDMTRLGFMSTQSKTPPRRKAGAHFDVKFLSFSTHVGICSPQTNLVGCRSFWDTWRGFLTVGVVRRQELEQSSEFMLLEKVVKKLAVARRRPLLPSPGSAQSRWSALA